LVPFVDLALRRIAQRETTAGGVKSDVGRLTSDVGRLTSDVVRLTSDVALFKSDVGRFKSDVTRFRPPESVETSPRASIAVSTATLPGAPQAAARGSCPTGADRSSRAGAHWLLGARSRPLQENPRDGRTHRPMKECPLS